VNGYKRFKPNSLAPDRVAWGVDNRGAMIRVVGTHGDAATRLENRSGEPAANPYLYMASQVVAGLDGVDRELDLEPATDAPYDVAAPRLPASLIEALDALRDDPLFAERFGPDFVAWYAELKRAELDRFLGTVTDWEQREYFDHF
jgi:glutamine synthetase